MGTSWNIIDTDLISSNIKDNVDIFSVVGNYTGWMGTLWVGQSQLLGSGVWFRTMPQYIIEIGYLYWLSAWLHAYVQYWDKLYVWIGEIRSSMFYNTHFLKIDLITWVIVDKGSAHQPWWAWVPFSWMNIDNNVLYWNCENANTGTYYHYELDLTTGAFTWPFEWVYHTWTTPQNTPITIWGVTFTISSIIASWGLQHGNSVGGSINWVWVLVS